MTPVKSNNIMAVGIHNDDLLVKYNTGVIYSYFGAASHYPRIMKISDAGGSVGSYVATNIRKANIPYAKLAERE